MRFVIDESSFDLEDCDDHEVQRALGTLLSLIVHCHEQPETVGTLSELYSTQVRDGIRLWDLIFQPAPPVLVPRDLRHGLMAALGRCVPWNESDDDIVALEAIVAGERLFAPSVAFVHNSIGKRAGRACLALRSSGRRGPKDVTVDDVSREVHFAVEERDTPAFYRSLFELEDIGEDDYFDIAKLAFPTLTFADGLAQQFRRFSRPYRWIRKDLTWCLAALDDHWPAACVGHPAPSEIQRRMKALTGVDMSPESPNTKANPRAWSQRRIVLDGHEYHCEWHVKLSPTADRIHFHPGTPGTHKGPIIGILAKHLDT